MRGLRVSSALILATACLLAGFDSAASECGSIKIGEQELDYKPGPMLSFAVYLSFDLAGGVYGSANVVQLAMGQKPDRHWRVGGWVFGSLHSLAGIGFLVASEHNGWERYLLGFGLGHLAWGLLTLGATTSVTLMSEASEASVTATNSPRISAQPILLSGARGEPAGGIGVTVTGW